MPDSIKYDPAGSPPSGASKKGDFIINPVGNGPTNTTGYWAMVNPGTGPYSVYLNKASNGPSIYICYSDRDLLVVTNNTAGQNYTTVAQCVSYFNGQTDKILLQNSLLDVAGNSAFALSMRKLRSSYTGSAIRVRRSSDNAEQDIGFDALGNLDTSSLNSFCSGTNGFVRTWYDQTGNGRDATQTTSANQPQIYKSATGIVTQNSLPSIEFSSTGTITMTGTYAVNGLNTMNLTLVGRGTQTGNQSSARGAIYWTESGSWGSIYFGFNQDFVLGRFGTGQANNNIGGSLSSSTALRYGNQIKDSTVEYVYVNNALRTQPTSRLTPIANTNSTYNLNYGQYGCYLSEVIVWSSTELAELSLINQNIANFYSI
jgi:hypothetical protein